MQPAEPSASALALRSLCGQFFPFPLLRVASAALRIAAGANFLSAVQIAGRGFESSIFRRYSSIFFDKHMKGPGMYVLTRILGAPVWDPGMYIIILGFQWYAEMYIRISVVRINAYWAFSGSQD